MLITEFGYAAFAGTHDNRYSEKWYADLMAVEFPAIAEKDYVCGATVWCWADHAWPPNNWYGFGNAPLSPFRGSHARAQAQGAVRCDCGKCSGSKQRRIARGRAYEKSAIGC